MICFWCLNIYHLNFFSDYHSVWKLFPSNVNLISELYFCFSVQKNTQYVLVFDAFVIVICLASLILCTRSIVLALRLRKVSVCSNISPPYLASVLFVQTGEPWCWVILPFLELTRLDSFEWLPAYKALVNLRCRAWVKAPGMWGGIR